MATFVDRVVLHATGGDGGHGVRLHPPREVQAARRPRRRQRRQRRLRHRSRSTRRSPRCSTSTTRRTARAARHAGHGRRPPRRRRRRPRARRSPTAPSSSTRDGEVLADLVGVGAEFVVAAAAAAGSATPRSPRPRRKAPGFALLGEPGDDGDVVLELKTIADVALVGLPERRQVQPRRRDLRGAAQDRRLPVHHARAQPRRRPGGRARATPSPTSRASSRARAEGKGLGLEFLRHIERCAVIVHVLDCATLEPDRDPLTRPRRHRGRARRLRGRRRRSAGVPLASARGSSCSTRSTSPRRASSPSWCEPDLEARGLRVFEVSAVSHEGLRQLTFALAEHRRRGPRRGAPSPRPPRSWSAPEAVDDAGFTVRPRGAPDGGASRCAASKPERWVRQTDFTQRRGRRLPRRPARAPRRRGGAVRRRCRRRARGASSAPDDAPSSSTGSPRMTAGAELLGPRGTDLRLEDPTRTAPRAARRARSYKERMDAKAEARAELWTERDAGHWADAATGSDAGTAERGAPRAAHRGAMAAARVVVKIGSSSLTAPRRPPRRARCAPSSTCSRPGGSAGGQVVLVSPPAPSPPGIGPLGLAARPRDLATPQAAASRRPGAPHRRVHRGVRATHGLRVGQVLLTADDIVRRDALPQRAARAGPAARPRRRARRQRERHGGDRRDPLRRQRPARRPRLAPGPRRRARPARRRRRPLRRAADAPRCRSASRSSGPADLDGRRASAARAGRRRAGDGYQARRRRDRDRAGVPSCSRRPRTRPRRSPARPRDLVPRDRAAPVRRDAVARARRTARRARWCSTRVRWRGRRPPASRCCRPGSPPSRALRGGRPGRPRVPDGAVVARGLVTYARPSSRTCWVARRRELPRARRRLRPRGGPPRRPRRPLTPASAKGVQRS